MQTDPNEIERVVCVSTARSTTGLFNQMEQIRYSALRRNPGLGIHAALLVQSGWFIHWLVGPADSVATLLAVVAQDQRHRDQRVLHRSLGRHLLGTTWSMMLSRTSESAEDFGQRVTRLQQDLATSIAHSPATVVRRLAAPMHLAETLTPNDPEAFHRIGVCATGTEAFDLVQWLALRANQGTTRRRVAGEGDADSASDFVDFLEDAQPCRVISVSRNALTHGLRRAFLSDWPMMAVLLSGDSTRDAAMVDRICEACLDLPYPPHLMAVSHSLPSQMLMASKVQRAGLRFVHAELVPAKNPLAIWRVIWEQLNELGRPSAAAWSPTQFPD